MTTSTVRSGTPAGRSRWSGRRTTSRAVPPPASSAWRHGPPATSAPRWTPSPRRSPACTRRAWSRTSWARPSCWRTCGWRADVRSRRAGSTNVRWPRPRATPGRCCPPPATCTSASLTSCASRGSSMRPRSTWRSRASSATGRRCWRTGTAGTPRRPHCCGPEATSRARVRIVQGRLEDARAWARERGVAPTDPPTYLAEYDQLTLARLLLAEGAAREALDLLDRVLDVAQAAGRDGSLVEAGLVRALAHHANGDADSAAADLAAALTGGVPAGHCRLFLDEGRPMAELLGQVARAAAHEVRTHAEHLLAAAHRPSPPAPAGPAFEEGLSERELEVLRLLATQLSGPQIARQLFVSVNTLRTHTKHIFTKLEVNTRRAAVRRAADLGLF